LVDNAASVPSTVAEIVSVLNKALVQQEGIVFALLFGSVAEEQATPLSDIDIGIFTKTEWSLMELGQLSFELQELLPLPPDLVVLNDLFRKSPLFAYRVVSQAVPIIIRDEESFIDFKKRSILYYLDHKPLFDMLQSAMDRRISEGTFGMRLDHGRTIPIA